MKRNKDNHSSFKALYQVYWVDFKNINELHSLDSFCAQNLYKKSITLSKLLEKTNELE